MPKILIVDDHPLFRQGVLQLLSREFRDGSFGEAGTAEEALASIRSGRWDVMLLDISLPGLSGVDLLRKTQQFPTRPRVLVLSMHPELQYAREVLQLGADGYLEKSSPPEELRRAVRKVAGGGKYVSPALAEMLVVELSTQPEKVLHETLSKGELRVLRRIAAGESVSEIARELSLSVKTVSTFRARILRKMHMKSNADLVRYAIQHSLTE